MGGISLNIEDTSIQILNDARKPIHQYVVIMNF